MADATIVYRTVTAPIEQRTIKVNFVGPGAALALSEAARSAAAAAAAEGFRDEAEGFAEDSGISAAEAAGSVDAAEAYAATAGAYAGAVEAAVSGVPSEAILYVPAATRQIMKGWSGLDLGQARYLSEPGRAGWFRVILYAGSEAAIAADPNEALRFRSVQEPTFAFERIAEGQSYLATWNGFDPAAPDLSLVEALDRMIPKGAHIELPSIDGFVAPVGAGAPRTLLILKNAGRLQGRGPGATHLRMAAGTSKTILCVIGSNCIVAGIRFSGLRDGNHADGRFCAEVGIRFSTVPDDAMVQDIDRIENVHFEDCLFDDADMGLRVINAGRVIGGVKKWVHPTGVSSRRVIMRGIAYQALSLWGRKLDIKADITMDGAAATRPFQTPCRIPGGSNGEIDLIINDPKGLPAFVIASSGEDSAGNEAGSEFNDARNLKITHRTKGVGNEARVYGFAGRILFTERCHYEHTNRFTETGETTAFLFSTGGEDPRNGTFIVEGGLREGFVHMALHDSGAFPNILFKGGRSTSNARTALATAPAVFSTSYQAITGYNGSPIAPIYDFRVEGWEHSAHDGVMPWFFRSSNKQPESYNAVWNCIAPEGTDLFLAVTSGTAVPNDQASNRTFPIGYHARLLANYTGYSASPRYSDNGPVAGGHPPIFDPNFSTYPDVVEYDT